MHLARPALAASLLALLMLAGCADDAPSDPADDGPAEGTGMDTDAGESPGGGNDTATPEAAEGSRETSTYEAMWALGWNAAGSRNTAVGDAWPQHTARGNVTGVIVEMSWTPATPLAQELGLYVFHEDQDAVQASGPSPVRLVFPGLDAAGDYRMAAVPAEEPATYVAQSVTFHVTVVTDQPLDPEWSALA